MRTQRFSDYVVENNIHDANIIFDLLKNKTFIIDKNLGGHNYNVSEDPYVFEITDSTYVGSNSLESGYPGGNHLRFDEFRIILGNTSKKEIMSKLTNLIETKDKLNKDIAFFNNMLIFARKQSVQKVDEKEFKQWMLDKNLDKNGNIVTTEESDSTESQSKNNGAVQST